MYVKATRYISKQMKIGTLNSFWERERERNSIYGNLIQRNKEKNSNIIWYGDDNLFTLRWKEAFEERKKERKKKKYT